MDGSGYGGGRRNAWRCDSNRSQTTALLRQGFERYFSLSLCASEKWSGRRDSNSRPLAPHASALPGCATSRLEKQWMDFSTRSVDDASVPDGGRFLSDKQVRREQFTEQHADFHDVQHTRRRLVGFCLHASQHQDPQDQWQQQSPEQAHEKEKQVPLKRPQRRNERAGEGRSKFGERDRKR